MSVAAQVVERLSEQRDNAPLSICHFTLVHTHLKSRTFHRQLLPLSRLGFKVTCLGPILRAGPTGPVTLIPIPARQTFLGRLKQHFSLLRQLLRQNAIYYFQDPQLLPLAFLLKLIYRKRVVYDAYEDFPSVAAAKRSIPAALRPLAAFAVSFAEGTGSWIFDAVVTADPITLRRLAYIGKSKKLVFYNFPNLHFFPEPRQRRPSFDLVYRGGLSERTGTFILLEALRLLAAERRPPSLLLIGYFDRPGTEKVLRDRIRDFGLESFVAIRGRIDHEAMADSLAEARIGLSPLLSVPKFQKNIPVKIFEYWACGLPVIASDLSPNRPFFRHGHAGLLVQPGSASELAGAIAYFLDHPAQADRMGRRGRELVTRRFNNAREIPKLRTLFEHIAGKVDPGGAAPCSNLS